MNVADQRVATPPDRFDALLGFVAKQRARLSGGGDLVYADVDHRRARLNEISANKTSPSNRRHQDVGLPGHGRQVTCARMTNGDRGVTLQQKAHDRAPHNLAAANDAGVGSSYFDLVSFKQFNDSRRRAGHKTW